MGTTSDKLAYLNTTKTKIKDAINLANTNITNETFRQYESKIKQALINTMNDKWGTWANFEKVTGTGETLTLNNTSEAPMKINLKGNTSQYSTTGKNLLKIKYTVDRGITTTINDDGSIKASGTATDTLAYLDTGENVSLEAGKYYLSLASAISVNLRVFLYNGGTQVGTMTLNAGDTTTSLTTTQTITSYSVIILGLTTNTNYNITLKPQLEKNDSSATSWEAYTGENPAPNPSYPQPINVVTGDNTIEVCGKNLFDINKYVSKNGWNITLENPLKGKEAGNYTISCVNNYITTNKGLATIFSNSVNGDRIGGYFAGFDFGNTKKSYSATITQEQTNATYMVIQAQDNLNTKEILDSMKIMIEKGNSASEYTPYQSQTYPIYLGVENLLKYPYRDTTKTENGITFTDIGDGTIKVNGTASANTYFYLTTTNDDTYKKYNGKKLTISGCPSGGSTNTYQIGFYNDNFSTGTSDFGNGGTFTGGDVRYNQAYIRISSGVTCDNLIFKPQLELGTKKNSYTPYGTTPIELCKIGDYQDEILKSTGKNLFDKDNVNYLNNVFIGGTGIITSGSGNTSIYISCNPNTTYTVSKMADNVFRIGTTSDVPTTGVTVDGYQDNASGSQMTITTSSNAHYLVVFLRNASSTKTLETLINSLMLNYGETALPYEPYGTGWYIKKQIGKVVLNGSETNWIKSSTYPGSFYAALLIKPGVIRSVFYCNYFTRANIDIGSPITGNYRRGTSFIETTQVMDFWFDDGTATIEDWKTWLSTHNTIVYYVLATTTNTEITDTTLINQLDNLQNLNSYNPTTNIMQENNDKPFIITATLLKAV